VYRIANLSESPKFFEWEFIPPSKNFNIENWFMEKLHVYDADNCGNRTSFWVFVYDNNKTFYKVVHNWWWYHKEFEIQNEFEITQVDKSELNCFAAENLKFVV
jgi:hypothetical protein